jgi:glycosyltransferase involved in cell wall biosynthesis
MISIVMAYQDRQDQLNKTLQTFAESKYRDFNVIIIDDCSKENITLPTLPFQVIVRKLTEKTWINSGVVFNMGFNYALEHKPDIILIQSPECYHVGDIISYAANVTDENYFSFACFKVNRDNNEDIFTLIENNNHIIKYNQDGTWSEPGAWGNHSIFDPVAFHYASAITTKNLVKINGFDERFAYGVSFEDDYLVRQIRNLGLKIDIIDNPFVVHQWHDSWQTIDKVPQMWDKNYRIYEEIIGTKEFKAHHLITPDLCGI